MTTESTQQTSTLPADPIPVPPPQPVLKPINPVRHLGRRISIQKTTPLFGLGCMLLWFKKKGTLNIHLFKWMICLS